MAVTIAVLAAAAAARPAAADASLTLQACRLDGVPTEALCGRLARPLDPTKPEGTSIDIHVAVLPALARNKKPDPVLVFAGGPGQSAIALAGQVQAMLGRFGTRRDLILVDQRGTGLSAPLMCEKEDPWLPLAQAFDEQRSTRRLLACAQALARLPHGDLRQYTTSIAMTDVEAVRQALGVPSLNLFGASYGTRAALEYLRLYPQHVRSAVLDGVAPADMNLPMSFSADNQAALDAVFVACEAETRCRARYPRLRAAWESLLASLPKSLTLNHPLSHRAETVVVTRRNLLALVRGPLYVPALAAMLPAAIDAAAGGRWDPLLALGSSLGGSDALRLAEGMHFSVICAEDMNPGAPQPEGAAAGLPPTGKDFADDSLASYREVCSVWPKSEVSANFYHVSAVDAPVLLLSGGDDPATPPRHAARVAAQLGPKATQVIVPHAGHGVMNLACVRDAVYRFVDDGGITKERAAGSDRPEAHTLDCASDIPRASAYIPVSEAASGAAR